MEFKGTKGKWSVRDTEKTVVVNENRLVITETDYPNTSVSESEANAKLIAAAPEMFEMLNKLLIEFEYDNATEYQCELFYNTKQLLTKITE